MESNALVYDTMLTFWRVVINLFFREVRPRGAYNIPRDGPVIFVAGPHANQFLDPLLLMSEAYRDTRRRVSFLIAAKSMKRKAVGFFAGLMDSIPVVRAADDAKPGIGLVYITEDDKTLLRGINTQFTKQLKPKMTVMLNKSLNFPSAEVLEVISDTEVRLKKEFGGEGSKLTHKVLERLASQEGKGLDYKVLPFVEQQDMYAHVYSKLKNGGCIGIFPEGGSHDRTDFLPFKAGVAVMALGAMAANPGLEVKIVPVGLSYFHPDKFRSRAVIEFGKPIPVPHEFVEKFKEGGAAKREAGTKLLDVVYDALKTVTLRAPDYETLMVVQAARRLYKTPGQHLSLGQVVELNKRFIAGYLHFKDEPRIIQLRENVIKYNRLVRDLGLRDHQVSQAKRSWWRNLGLLLYRSLLLTVWSLFALPGVVLNGPIFLLASIISKKKAREALAASTVKIAAKDVIATWKILISMGVAPILYTIYAIIATVVATKAGAPVKWRIAAPSMVITALPMVGYAALKFGEAGMDVLKSLRPLIVSLFPGQQKELENLKKMRQELQVEVSSCIEDFGPKMYEDFDEWRMIPPSASVPPSSETLGLWRRKSHNGGLDAPGTLLNHPMQWIDERLFGWSRSARRGTSAWGGQNTTASSSHTSRVASPEASDDEDTGDYDHVIGYLPSIVGSTLNGGSGGGFGGGGSGGGGGGLGISKGSRSNRGSYADLASQKKTDGEDYLHAYRSARSHPPSPLTMSGTSPFKPVSSSEALHTAPGNSRQRKTTGGRERKASLSDAVPVERIGKLDRVEPFKEATEELNKETEEKRRAKAE